MPNLLRTISRFATLSLVVCTYLLTSFAGLTHEISHFSAHARTEIEQAAGGHHGTTSIAIDAPGHTHSRADLSGSLCFFCTSSFGTLLVESSAVASLPEDTGVGTVLVDSDAPTAHPLHHPSLRAPPVKG